jgi:adenylate cyclase
MFTDMVGYTAASQADEAGALTRRREQEDILVPLVTEFGGRKVKSTGDGILAEFASALMATECAVEIQRRVQARNLGTASTPIALRIGIHLGDVEEVGGDIFGDAVNLAARVEPLAEPGGVCVSEEVYAQVHNKIKTGLEKQPPREVKGVQLPLTVYRVSIARPAQSTPDAPRDPSRIAVLPFANISPDPHDEYFAEGLTDELITVLAQLRGARVIARTSVAGYKGTTKSVAQIGSELGVSSILEGSVRRAGERIRISAQLIEVDTQNHAWAKTFDRNLSDVLAVQAEVAREVAGALKIQLRRSEELRLELQGPVQSESYLACARGRARLMESFSKPSLEEARREFQRAVDIDPVNARAYAGLADATHLLGLFWDRSSRRDMDRLARELASRAVTLDPNLSDAHSALGLVLYDSNEWLDAETEALRALSLNPSFSLVRTWYALMLSEEGRGEEALEQLRLAREADPQSVQVARLYGVTVCYMHRSGDMPDAISRLEKIETDPVSAHYVRAHYHYFNGDLPAAFRELDRAEAAREEPGTVPLRLARLKLLALSGQTAQARKLLGDIDVPAEQASSLVERAVVLAFTGDIDGCFELLHREVERGGIALQQIRLDPDCEPIRRDPRFAELLKRVKMPPRFSQLP